MLRLINEVNLHPVTHKQAAASSRLLIGPLVFERPPSPVSFISLDLHCDCTAAAVASYLGSCLSSKQRRARLELFQSLRSSFSPAAGAARSGPARSRRSPPCTHSKHACFVLMAPLFLSCYPCRLCFHQLHRSSGAADERGAARR